jgi:hypothetical protein
MARNYFSRWILPGAIVALLFSTVAARAEKTFTVSKWDRAEITLKSSVNYTNAIQESEVRVLFVSPLGETNRVYGFWDGGKIWRVRFKPTFPGRWKYFTMCSDTRNRGLHGQSGEFECTAAKGDTRFTQHGPIQIARSQQHLEQADRTPFLWLGDTAWLAAVKSSAAEWKEYCDVRAAQKFNVTAWRLLGEKPDAKASLFSGTVRVKVNLETARELDLKVTTANRAGLLNAIAPLWEVGENSTAPLPEDQAIAVMRYAVARWGADDVAWVVAFECDAGGTQAARWQRIGRAVFNAVSHAPVVLLPGESVWALDGFRQERWANVFGIQTKTATDEASLAWLQNGPIAAEKNKLPLRPIITLNPPTETASPSARNVDATLSRQLIWWSLLINTPVGISYAARDVSEWNAYADNKVGSQPWREALTLPGAANIAPAAEFFAGKDFWRFETSVGQVAGQPGFDSPLRHVVAARTEARDMSVVYSPQDRAFNIERDALPANPKLTWLNPRTGELRPANANADANATALRFETPSAGDWLLVARSLLLEKPTQLASRQKNSSGEIDKRK